MTIKNSYKFFNNRACKYFPCHTAPESDSFNCLFCYCPLYFLGAQCGGNFKYSGEKNIKNCTDCHLPHLPEYYDAIISKLKEAGNK
ncbi:MAG: cysteine-rich small domain-containing protein [Treponema sp.]|nr:cysteine-rich small domain-containing protein [Treponema sp.]